MWPFKSRQPEIWQHFPARPEDAQGTLSAEQRDFIFWSLETGHKASRREAREVRRVYQGACAAGHQGMADNFLHLSLSLSRANRNRIVADGAFWEEYQRVMVGKRVDLRSYLVGELIPTGDRRPWGRHPERPEARASPS